VLGGEGGSGRSGTADHSPFRIHSSCQLRYLALLKQHHGRTILPKPRINLTAPRDDAGILVGQSTSVYSPLMAASATLALKAGLWFRRGRRVMVSPVPGI
jgi:hypothetical protein